MNKFNSFINIHSHYKPYNKELVIRNAYQLLDVYNIDKLNYNVSVGIHPWHCNKDLFIEDIAKIKKLASLQKILAIGEIGLDKKCKTDFNIQKLFFEEQLKIAQLYSKPVILHIVKAYYDIIPFIKKYKVDFIIHNYSGNQQVTNELLKCENVYYSFGVRNIDKLKILKGISIDKIFLETDNVNMPIEEVYKQAQDILNVNLIEIISNNFNTVFNK